MTEFYDIGLIWAHVVFFIIVSAWLWVKGQHFGWRRLSDFSMVVLVSFAATLGVEYFIAYDKIPWCYGVEETLAKSTTHGHGAIALLVLLAFVAMYILRFGLKVYGKAVMKSKNRLPGIGSITASMLVIIVILQFVATGAAYYYKDTEKNPGMYVSGFVLNCSSRVFEFAGEFVGDDQVFPSHAKNKNGK